MVPHEEADEVALVGFNVSLLFGGFFVGFQVVHPDWVHIDVLVDVWHLFGVGVVAIEGFDGFVVVFGVF